MEPREERGLAIAKIGGLVQRGRDLWIVPSQTHSGSWMVDWTGGKLTCTCPDFSKRAEFCKHIFATLIFSGRTPVKEKKNPTYTQNWPAYNKAQMNEGKHFQELLYWLCQGITMKPQTGRGRPKTRLCDIVFAMVYKVYTGFSGRRATSELRRCAEAGLMAKAPGYNTVSDYMQKDELTPLLRTLIQESASPLAGVEYQFAADATGFGTKVYDCYFDHKWGKHTRKAQFRKAHAICGVETNIVTDLLINDRGDATQFVDLLDATGKRFNVAEVSADKAYSSKKNLVAAEAMGVVPYIPFREGTVEGAGPSIWRQMFHYFKYKEAEFGEHYHRRSNIETVFSMVKTKFGASVKSKSVTGQTNELYCKFLCHNICVLISSIYELGIEPEFWTTDEVKEVA